MSPIAPRRLRVAPAPGLAARVTAGVKPAAALAASALTAAAIATALVALAPPAPAQDTDDEDEAEPAADRWCAPEPGADTFHRRGDARVAADDPPADIRETCATHFGDVLTFELAFAAPFDAAQWGGGSVVTWFVDLTGDGENEYLVEMELEEGEPTVEVVDRRGEEDLTTCTGPATVEGGRLKLAGIQAGCFGDPDWLRATATAVRDTAPDDDDPDTLAFDLTEERVGIAPPSADPRRGVGRLTGDSRLATSARIAEAAFPAGADRVYLARAGDFADALAASSVAGQQGRDTDGAVLLVPSCGELPEPTAEALADLAPSEIVALGGEQAVCEQVLSDAGAAAGADTGRLAGAHRWATAARIARIAFPDGADTVYVATGEGFADALAAGALTDGPVLLAPSCGEPPSATTRAVEALNPGEVVAVGGTAALCDELLLDVAGGRDVARLRDPDYRDRFGTARAVAEAAFPDGAETTYLARGDAFADALSATNLTDGPVLLTPSCGDLPPASARAVRHLEPDGVVALGGEQAVCDAVRRHAANS